MSLSCHAGLDVTPTRTGKLAMPNPVPLLYYPSCMSLWAQFDTLTVIGLFLLLIHIWKSETVQLH